MKIFRLSRRAAEKVQKHSDILSEYSIQDTVTNWPQELREYLNEEYKLIVIRRKKKVTFLVHEHEYEIVVYGIHVTKIG